jgi:RHS repeat-associated protein
MTYDSSGRRLTLVDPRGNAAGGVPNDHKTSWSYDAADHIASVTDADGNQTSDTYDDAGRPHTMVTPDGTTTYDYDNADRLTATTDPRGGVTRRTYEAGGSLASLEKPEGGTTSYEYDNAGEPRGNTSGATPSDYTWTYTYDDAGNRLSESHPDAGTTNYTYDVLNRITAIEDPLGHTTTIDYNANGDVTRRTDDLGHHQDYDYDNLDQVTTATDPRGKTTTYDYFPTEQLKSVTTPLGHKTSYTLNDDGETATMVEARGNESGATPSDYTWTYGYDADGELTSATDPLSDATHYTYDAVGNELSAQDANSNTTSYTYDAMNRLETVTAPGTPTATTSYVYDADGDLHTRTDPKGNLTTWDHDLDGRLTGLTNPVGTWAYEYDDAGNLVTQTKPSGTSTPTIGDGEITYTYDRMNRLTGVDYSDSTPDVTYAYNHAGLRTAMADGAGTESFQYDTADRLTDVTRGTDTFHYDYDQLNLTGSTYPDGTTITAAYNDDEEPTSLTVGTQTTNLDYDAAGRLVTTANPSSNGYTETRTYDRAGRLTTLSNDNGSTVLSRFTRTLDPAGNPTLVATLRGSTTNSVAYTYDARERLTKACYGAITCTGASTYLAYGYDKNSNLTTEDRVGSVPNPASWILTYNSADQLTSRTDGTNTISYTYDANGDQVTAGTATYTYNLADQLTSAAQSGATTAFTYDGDGNRLTSDTSGGANLRYWWDIANPMPMLAQENDAGTGTMLRRYQNGPQGPLSMTTGGSTYYFARDPLGSITDLTDASGAAEWSWDYEPYGATLAQNKLDPSAPTVTLGYTGQYLDATTATYDMRAREYDPSVGRFGGLDPLPGEAGEPYGAAYLYADGQPTVLIDPTGQLGLPPMCFIWCDTDPLAPLHSTEHFVEGGIGLLEGQGHQLIGQATNPCTYMPWAAQCALDTVRQGIASTESLAQTVWQCAHGDGRACGATTTVAAEIALLHRVCPPEAGVTAEDGTTLARRLGSEGERSSGIDPSAKVRIPSATGTAVYRIPDALTDTTLTEVKNVAQLGYTNQIQDFEAYASRTGRSFDLIVRQDTTLSQQLQALADSGAINVLRRLPSR